MAKTLDSIVSESMSEEHKQVYLDFIEKYKRGEMTLREAMEASQKAGVKTNKEPPVLPSVEKAS